VDRAQQPELRLPSPRTADARAEAQEAIRLQPYSTSGHRNLAFAYLTEGQLDLAMSEAREAVRLAPKSDVAHYALGLCFMEQGESEQAIAEFRTFLGLYWDRAYARDYKAKAEEYVALLE
jgi:tetratricopeptide (TPR) repeat protein